MLETRSLTFPVCKETVVIQEGDGFVDRLLLKKNKKFFDVVNDYIAALTVSMGGITKVTSEHVIDLLAPDHTFLQVECFRLSYGELFEFDHFCGACGETSPQSVDLTKLEFRELAPELDSTDPIFSFVLPRSKLSATVGMLTNRKEIELIQHMMTSGVDLNQSDFLSLRELDGSSDFSFEDVIKLPLADHKAIRKAKKRLVCGYDTSVRITCPSCEDISIINLLTHRDFLLPTG